MKPKPLLTFLFFVLSFFFSNQSVFADRNSEMINHELASLVTEADKFLVQNASFALAGMHQDFSWNPGNLSYVTVVSLFSLCCIVLISFQYVISERNRKPAKR